MDENVRKALARWPDVPAAYGWLSLDPRGAWRFHAGGAAYADGAGETIGNIQIRAFIGRNYTHDDQGNWFFQNGPQRVYVRLDAAPLIVHRATDGRLITHTSQPFEPVTQWVVDDMGRLYGQSGAGPGMIDDRDLAAVCESLLLADGTSALDTLATLAIGQTLLVRQTPAGPLIDVVSVTSDQIPAILAFIHQPDTAVRTASSAPALR